MSGRKHQRDSQLAAVKDGSQIGAQDAVPVFRRHVLKKADVIDPGIVDKYIQRAKLLTDHGKHLLTDGHIPHVSEKCGTGYLIAFDFFFSLHQLLFAVRAVDNNVVALLGEFYGNGLSDPTGSAGHKHNFLCHKDHSFLWLYSTIKMKYLPCSF